VHYPQLEIKLCTEEEKPRIPRNFGGQEKIYRGGMTK
jgi:hypothetical protein